MPVLSARPECPAGPAGVSPCAPASRPPPSLACPWSLGSAHSPCCRSQTTGCATLNTGGCDPECFLGRWGGWGGTAPRSHGLLPSARRPVRPAVRQSVLMDHCPSAVTPSIHLPIYFPSIHLSMHLHHPSICPLIRLSVHPSTPPRTPSPSLLFPTRPSAHPYPLSVRSSMHTSACASTPPCIPVLTEHPLCSWS